MLRQGHIKLNPDKTQCKKMLVFGICVYCPFNDPNQYRFQRGTWSATEWHCFSETLKHVDSWDFVFYWNLWGWLLSTGIKAKWTGCSILFLSGETSMLFAHTSCHKGCHAVLMPACNLRQHHHHHPHPHSHHHACATARFLSVFSMIPVTSWSCCD